MNSVDSNLVLTGEPSYTTHFNLQRETWITLNKLAYSLRCTWGHRPSISRMLREIAAGKLSVVPTDRLISEDDLHVLMKKPMALPLPEDDQTSRALPSQDLPTEMPEPGLFDQSILPDDDSPPDEVDDEP